MKLGFNIQSSTDSIYKLEKRLDPVNPPYIEYYKSNNNTSPTMGSWSKTIPFWENGYFLWTRWVYTYTNGTLEMSDPVLDKTWSIMTDYEASKSWTKRFDELTNYGKVKGIICDPISNALYFNADYINAGKIKALYIDTQGLIIRENSQGYLEPVLVDDGTEGLRLSDVAKSGSYSDLDGKPNLSSVATSGNYSDLSGKPNLSSVATSGQYSDLNGKPALSTVATSGKYSDLDGKPNLSSVATSGNYSDLNDKPNLSVVATSGKYSDLLNSPKLSTVATSGNYSDLNGKPDISGNIKTALKGYIYADGVVGATPKDGATGFLVSSDGTLQASNAVIYGKVVASAGAIGGIYIYKNSIASQNGKFSVDENGYINTKSGTIGGIDIADNELHSWQYLTYNGDYLLDGNGNKIIKNLFSLDNEGNLYALNAHIGGSIDIGTSIGNNTTIADLINSKNDFDSRKETIDKNNEIIQQNKSIWDESAKAQIENDRIIANWCKSNDKTLIDGAKIYAGSITAEQITTDNIVGTNGWINIHEGTFNFGDKISWDGTTLSINGNGTFSGKVTATKGSIGGITINSNSITAPNFSLSSSGALTASNANISGTINATYGKIASYLIKDGYLMSEDEQVGMSAGDISFWAGHDKNDGSYNFRVTKDGDIVAGYNKTTGSHAFKVTKDGALSVTAGTIGNWSILGGSLRTYGSDTCIQWVEGSSGGMLGSIEARNTTMANKSGLDGQDTRGIIIAGYYGATVDIGLRGNENNSLDPLAWYSAIHIDGLSTVIRNPGGSISSYIQLRPGCIAIDPNTVDDYAKGKILMYGPMYVDNLLNGNNLKRAKLLTDSGGPYVELIFGDVDRAYGVRAWLSDAKYKNTILDTTVNATSIIRRLAFRQFNWNSNGQHTKIGLVAQELKKIDSDLVTEITQPDGSTTYQINDITMAMITAKATQETISRIDKLESSVNSKIFQNKNEIEARLITENQKLKDRLDYLEARIKYISGEKSSYSE